MATLNEKLLNDVMSLPKEIRAELADKLLESLNDPDQAEIDAFWQMEAERRVAEIQSGKVNTIPGDQVLKDYAHKKESRLLERSN